jgi:hypothetical protein
MGFTGKGRELQKSNSWFFCREKYGGEKQRFFCRWVRGISENPANFFFVPRKSLEKKSNKYQKHQEYIYISERKR